MFPDAVIFDFDGVIADTEPLHHKAFQQALQPLGMGFSWQEYQKVYMGFDDRDAFRELFRSSSKKLDDQSLQELISKKAESFQQVIAEGVTPYPGVLELINRLAERQIPLGISSGALRSDIIPIIGQLKITERFSTIVTADDVPQSKPDPASYRMAMQNLIRLYPDTLHQSSCIFAIEDTPAGIQSAKGTGLKVVAVTNSYPAELLTQADYTVASLVELLEGFKGGCG